MVEYESCEAYIQSKTEKKAKIAAIEIIIDLLLTTAAKAALSEDVTEYWLDDGQTKIKTVRRSVAAITKSIEDLRRLQNVYNNEITGRVTILRDSKNFTGRFNRF